MKTIIEKLNNYKLNWINELIKTHPKSEIYLVGGAVRDFLLNRETKDLDFVVRNLPAEKLENFLNKYGKLNFVGKSFGVYKFKPKKDDIEFDIALPRTEHSFNTGGYKDVDIKSDYTLEIEKDLERRDFTINAIALKLTPNKNKLGGDLVDPFEGQKDIKKKLIKAVGKTEERFQEDATRMLRAIRFSCQLDFKLDKEITKTILQKNNLIKKIAFERIGEELNKIILTPKAEQGIKLLLDLKILDIILPELKNCLGVDQSRNHIYDVYKHLTRSLGFASQKNYSLEIKWASLLHDIGKPQTRAKQGDIFTFFNHEYLSAKITKKILNRFRYSDKFIKKVSHLVRHHMFYYNTGEITDSAVRRLLRKVGPEHIDDLIKLRIADRLGMGRPKGKPFKLVELERRFKEVSLDPLSVKMLKIDGADVMKELKIEPGPKIGMLLNALFSEVLDDPSKNTKDYLIKKLKELNKISDDDLKKLAPDIEKHEEVRRTKIIGKPLVFKGEKLKRKVRKIKNPLN